ncbi:MAG: carboxymuconolactone decarboxylase family protein [Dehalococcoidia bacterium]|nr:carboxymuconolactone decarboxylase family protein [Dehalococcoidia bacterium]
MSRLPAMTRGRFPDELGYVWDRLPTVGGEPLNVYKAIGNNPPLLRAYLRLGDGLWKECGLDLKRRELAILRVAVLQHSTYEWHQHVRIAREAGVEDARIRELRHWRPSALYSPAERAMLAYVDALATSDHALAEVHAALAEHFPASTIVGINLLAGYYMMTARFLGAMEVALEGPFVGWELEGD